MKQKALRAGDAHLHEDEECRKRSTLRARMCRGTFFLTCYQIEERFVVKIEKVYLFYKFN